MSLWPLASGRLPALPPQGPLRGRLGFLSAHRGLRCPLQPSVLAPRSWFEQCSSSSLSPSGLLAATGASRGQCWPWPVDAQQGRQGGGKPERARQCQDWGCAAWVLCERWHECRGGPPQPPLRLPGSPGHPLQLLPPSSVPCLSITFPRKLTHIPTCCCFLPLPCPPRRGPGCSCLTPCLPPLSPLFSAFSPTASRSGQASPSRPESPRPPFDL